MRNMIQACVDPPIPVVVLLLLIGLVVLMRRTTRSRALVLLISSVLALGVAEGLCRVLGVGASQVAVWKEPVARDQEHPYEPHGDLVYRYPSNPRGYFDENNEVIGSINSGGFRGAEEPTDQPDSMCRVVFLGDSFTLGVGVRDEDTLPESFEREVGKAHINIEALNLGVSGTSTDEQIELLRDFGLTLNPDVVVVVMFLNDANRIWTIRFLSRPVVLARVRKHSYFINAVFQAVERPILERAMVRHYRDGYEDDDEGWQSIVAALEEGKILSERNEFRLVVALYPVLIHLDEKRYPFRGIHEKVGRTCESMGIPFVDFFEGLRGQKDRDLWVHATDQHPNEAAHAIAGRQLADHLLDQPWFCSGRVREQVRQKTEVREPDPSIPPDPIPGE